MLADPVVQAAGVTGACGSATTDRSRPRRRDGRDHLISDQRALRADPPDILLTNYKMLDRLLTNESRQRLWAANTPPTDGSDWEQPLSTSCSTSSTPTTAPKAPTSPCCSAASATGSAPQPTQLAARRSRMRRHVGNARFVADGRPRHVHVCARVFGHRFDAASVVGEQRKTVAEVCPDIDFSLPTPRHRRMSRPSTLTTRRSGGGVHRDDSSTTPSRRRPAAPAPPHGSAPRSRGGPAANLGRCRRRVAQQVPSWGEALAHGGRRTVATALERFVALVSLARGRSDDRRTRRSSRSRSRSGSGKSPG